jgi:LytS/YehU family sensor histidine kinase
VLPESYHCGIGNVDEEAVMAVVRSRVATVVAVIILVWLIIGVIAAVQRGYFGGSDTNCAKVSTTIVTIISGPLNYVGVNPKIDCSVPQPSK